jgi:hypothetical protein
MVANSVWKLPEINIQYEMIFFRVSYVDHAYRGQYTNTSQ